MAITCFHGTTEKAADSIIDQKKLLLTREPHSWLGEGIYLFQEAPLLAWHWAVEKCNRPSMKAKSAKPAILRFDIELGVCFDLLDISNYSYLEKAHQVYSRVSEPETQKQPQVTRHNNNRQFFFSESSTSEIGGFNYLDNKVIALAISEYERANGVEVDSIRAPFLEGKELYKNSYFYNQYHVQIVLLKPTLFTPGRGKPTDLIRYSERMDTEDLSNRYQSIITNSPQNTSS